MAWSSVAIQNYILSHWSFLYKMSFPQKNQLVLQTIPCSWHCIGVSSLAGCIYHGHTLVPPLGGCIAMVPCPVLATLHLLPHLLTLLTACFPALHIFMSYCCNPSNRVGVVVRTEKIYAWWLWISCIWITYESVFFIFFVNNRDCSSINVILKASLKHYPLA